MENSVSNDEVSRGLLALIRDLEGMQEGVIRFQLGGEWVTTRIYGVSDAANMALLLNYYELLETLDGV